MFSQRMGLKPVKVPIQLDTVSEDLRIQLWNISYESFWKNLEIYSTINQCPNSRSYTFSIWKDYFKKPIDNLPNLPRDFVTHVRYYFFNCKWFEVYDFIEVLSRSAGENFRKKCNDVLEKENSGYRFVNLEIAPITNNSEINEIEQAINSPINTVTAHLKSALNLFSNKDSPDYRNSIKESISAIEALCKLITQNQNATLGDALNAIERQTGGTVFHPALTGAFHKLYGYTNDADGIRHAFKDEKVNSGFEEAKFMLVTCSAFVNYLISKASKAGIKL